MKRKTDFFKEIREFVKAWNQSSVRLKKKKNRKVKNPKL